MSSSKFIPVGSRDGKLVGIHELSIDESGDRCRCYCPECKVPLIACSMEGKISKHFRHKSGERHCHFKVDKFFMDYIMEFLSSIGNVPELNQDEFLRMNIKSKLRSTISNENDEFKARNNNLSVVEVKDHRVKIKIEDTEFWINLVFRKRDVKESEDVSININLSDLYERCKISKEDWSKIREIAFDRIMDSCKNRTFQQIGLYEETKQINCVDMKKIASTEIVSDDLEIKERQKNIVPDFKYNRIYGGQCPKCKKGKLKIRIRHDNGQKFFGCSNYPTCIFTVKEYYDLEYEKWIYAI